jgi:hypothetical protein
MRCAAPLVVDGECDKFGAATTSVDHGVLARNVTFVSRSRCGKTLQRKVMNNAPGETSRRFGFGASILVLVIVIFWT